MFCKARENEIAGSRVAPASQNSAATEEPHSFAETPHSPAPLGVFWPLFIAHLPRIPLLHPHGQAGRISSPACGGHSWKPAHLPVPMGSCKNPGFFLEIRGSENSAQGRSENLQGSGPEYSERIHRRRLSPPWEQYLIPQVLMTVPRTVSLQSGLCAHENLSHMLYLPSQNGRQQSGENRSPGLRTAQGLVQPQPRPSQLCHLCKVTEVF